MRHLLLAMFVSVALIGCSDKAAPDKQTLADIRAGKVVAEKECKACHGLDGKGAAPGIPNLAGQRGRYIMAALQEYKERRRVHAALRTIATDLTEDQTRGVATFYASLTPLPPEKAPGVLALRQRPESRGGLRAMPRRRRQQRDRRHAQSRRPAAASISSPPRRNT